MPPSPRTILPTGDTAIVKYTILGLGPGGEAFTVETAEGQCERDVLPGIWSITAKAVNAVGELLLEGSTEVTVRPGIDCQANIELAYPAGKGVLEFEAIMPQGIGSGTEILIEWVGPDGPGSYSLAWPDSSIRLPLSPGYHRLGAKLRFIDGAESGLAETVKIIPGFITRLTADFSSRVSNFQLSITYLDDRFLEPSISMGPILVRGIPLIAAVSGLPLNAGIEWFSEGSLAATGSSAVIGTTRLPLLFRLDALASIGYRGGSASVLVPLADVPDQNGYCSACLLGSPDKNSPDHQAEYCASDPGSGISAIIFSSSSSSTIQILKQSPAMPYPLATATTPIKIDNNTKRVNGIAIIPGGREAYAFNRNSSWLARISLETNGDIQKITITDAESIGMPSGSTIISISPYPDGSKLAILEGTSRGVYVYPLASGIITGDRPYSSISRITGAQTGAPTVNGIAARQGAIIAWSESADKVFLLADSPTVMSITSVLDRTTTGGLIDAPASIAVSTQGDVVFIASTASSSLVNASVTPLGFGVVKMLIDGRSDSTAPKIEGIALSMDGSVLITAVPSNRSYRLYSLSGPIPVLIGDLLDGMALPSIRGEIATLSEGFLVAGCTDMIQTTKGAAFILRKQ
jgi:hypothetical protein